VMRFLQILLVTAASLWLIGCASSGGGWSGSGGNIGDLRGKKIEVKEEKIEGGLEKAIAGYKKFLESTPESEQSPEALRRLADLKIQEVEGIYDPNTKSIKYSKPGSTRVESPIGKKSKNEKEPQRESLDALEKRSAKEDKSAGTNKLTGLPGENTMAQQVLKDDANSREAIGIYLKLLKKYPEYDRNDRVLYQLARAYGIRGQQDKAMQVLNRIVREYPYTPLIDEVQFRRGEILFVRKRYHDAQLAYGAVVKTGRRSNFYDQALYKHGWSLFKQSHYEQAIDSFIRLIDEKAAGGRAAIDSMSPIEKQRLNDTLRVVSFSFSYLGGADAVDKYFKTHGRKSYEDMLFADLGEHYLVKRRYADAAQTFARFVQRNPLHDRAPEFQRNVIAVYEKGGFPKLVIESKREFANIYDPKGNYWKVHDINKQPKTLAFIKQNLVDLAKHYHALSQKRHEAEDRKEAIVWYRRFLASFPADKQAPEMNFLLADLLFDNHDYLAAAKEYEKTAYHYPPHKRSSEAAYASVLAYREQIKKAPEAEKPGAVYQAIASSIRFADAFPKHPEAAGALDQAAIDTYKRKEYEKARTLAQRVIKEHPEADSKILRSAWTVSGHASFELSDYTAAEQDYKQALNRLPEKSKQRGALLDRLAASAYKQGEAKQDAGDLKGAAKDYLRVAQIAPTSSIRQTADYDAAAALIKLKQWGQAISVLESYRKRYPHSKEAYSVAEKLAVAYEKDRQWRAAAVEFDRIRQLTKDPEVRREASYRSAKLFDRANDTNSAIVAYRRFIKDYASRIDQSIEARNSLAELYGKTKRERERLGVLKDIVRVDQTAGKHRTDRTRYLAALAKLELSEPLVRQYKKIRLTLPLKRSLARKKKSMEQVLKVFSDMLDYKVADVTTAATYRIADTYYDLTQAILKSDRPRNLNKLELEQYNILLEEQSYPFEEKAIELHKKNLQFMRKGIYNKWVDKSIEELGKLVPARYNKPERGESVVESVR
jgi:TolA-binding protein